MSKLLTYIGDRRAIAVVLAVILAVFLVVSIVEAATTISTNINTGGTLTVTGVSILTATTTHGSDVVSDTDSTDRLGTSTVRWASTFSDNFTGNTITLDGGTGVNVLTITNNVADALSIIDSSGDLLVFDTRTGVEVFAVTPNSTFAGTLTVTATTTIGGIDLFVGTDDGVVGIGTTSPTNLLHVESTTGTSTMTISSGGTAGGRIILEDTDGAGCSEISVLNGAIIVEEVACPTGI